MTKMTDRKQLMESLVDDELLRRIFPPGVQVDLDNMDFSIAIPYEGPPIEKLPKVEPLTTLYRAQPIYLSDPVQVESHRSRSAQSPVTGLVNRSSISEASSISVSPLSPAIDCSSSPTEIEELPSPSRLLHSPNLPYSGEYSAPESGEFLYSPATNGESSNNLDSSPTGGTNANGGGRKRGRCYKCFKGNRFTDKEVCLVCGAKYCGNCVLTVMGSMPEGRKCEGCIGLPIMESRRLYLGKPSRLLRRLLSPLEVMQSMKSERECLSNQLQPQQVIVNDRSLSPDEMLQLLVRNPKLKPGRYWYDRVSGLWGREGEKPDLIIAADLKVGGDLKTNASHGCTQVYLNAREVTKSELKMLKLTGVPCPPQTYLVLYADGSYMEEGHNEVKGNIWAKASSRWILHLLFSLPTPRANATPQLEFDNASNRNLWEVRHAHKILLLGHDGSGRSTIFKQAKIIHENGFSTEEVQKYKELILQKVRQYLYVLLEARERFEEELTNQSENFKGMENIYSMDEEMKELANQYLDGNTTSSTTSTTLLNKLWQNPAVQATYERKDELHMLPDMTSDLLDRVLAAQNYQPSEYDILHAEGLEQGTGLAEVEFSLEDKESFSGVLNGSQDDVPNIRYRLISIGGLGMNEFRKWLDMFEDIQVLIYCVAISDYDQLWTDSNGVVHNKLIFSRDLFAKIVTYPCFQDTPLVLLLNKHDKFEDKILQGIQLTKCEWFSDYCPVGSSSSSVIVQQAYMYVVHKYKRMFEGRRLYTLQLNARQRASVLGAFEYVQQILKCEDEKKSGYGLFQDESIYSTTEFVLPGHMDQR